MINKLTTTISTATTTRTSMTSMMMLTTKTIFVFGVQFILWLRHLVDDSPVKFSFFLPKACFFCALLAQSYFANLDCLVVTTLPCLSLPKVHLAKPSTIWQNQQTLNVCTCKEPWEVLESVKWFNNSGITLRSWMLSSFLAIVVITVRITTKETAKVVFFVAVIIILMVLLTWFSSLLLTSYAQCFLFISSY